MKKAPIGPKEAAARKTLKAAREAYKTASAVIPRSGAEFDRQVALLRAVYDAEAALKAAPALDFDDNASAWRETMAAKLAGGAR